jgi:hypothetical protein
MSLPFVALHIRSHVDASTRFATIGNVQFFGENGTINDYWRIVSNNQFWMAGNVRGWYRMPINQQQALNWAGGNGNRNALVSACRSAAAAGGGGTAPYTVPNGRPYAALTFPGFDMFGVSNRYAMFSFNMSEYSVCFKGYTDDRCC